MKLKIAVAVTLIVGFVTTGVIMFVGLLAT